MNLILDPVWPWASLWEALVQVPVPGQFAALAALLLAFVLPILWFAGWPRAVRWGGAGLVFLLLVVAWHTWPVVQEWSAKAEEGGAGASPFRSVGLSLVLMLLLLGPPALIGASIGSYLGTPGMSKRQLTAVAILRVAAFTLALIAIARPALAAIDLEPARVQLLVAVDRSRSMTVQDELGKQSRWETLLRHLRAAEPALSRLRDEQQVEILFSAFAEDIRAFDSEAAGEPDGKRTDIGGMLRALFDRRDPRLPLRALLLLSDGADNGGVPALAEAARYRGQGAAIHTFALGNPGTTTKQNDAAITSITTSPMPFVPVKGKLTVKLSIDARGYENSKGRVRLFAEGDDGKGGLADREVLAQDVVLPLTTGNEVTLVTDAPDKPGEIKIKAVLEMPEPDDLPLNNVIETFVSVSREGISVLLVDRQRSLEPQKICDALSQDPRIRVTPIWVRGGRPLVGAGKLFNFEEQPYDVIILGDVKLEQLRAIDADALNKVKKQVARGAGLLVLGGYVNLGNGDWKGSELEELLPVDLAVAGQEENPVRMTPTEDGLLHARYILRLDDKDDVKVAWTRLAKLEGLTKLALRNPRRGTEHVLATTQTGEPLLIMQTYAGAEDKQKPGGGAARVLVFGGDTTNRWVRNEESQRLHERFWKQMIVWLARQEDAEGSVWVKPDSRRLPVRTDLGFQVGLRGKGGGPDLRDGKYEVDVIAPDGTRSRVNVAKSVSENRGVFLGAQSPGVYRLVVKGEGKDPSGNVVAGEASARVIVYDEDTELSKPAADPEFLKKLAVAAGGEALRIEQLGDFLNRLAERPVETGKPKMELRPDWRTTERSSFLLVFFVVFCVLVCLEWGLRRYWGLV